MIRIGITGGIGSGKSVVSEILSCMGIPTYNADNASKRIISTRKEIINALKKLLGSEIYAHGNHNTALGTSSAVRYIKSMAF